MRDRYALGAWLLITAVLLALLGVGALVVEQSEREALVEARVDTEREHGLLASLIKGQLQGGSYQLAAETLQNWGKAEPAVVALRLLASNGYTIAEYQRGMPAERKLTVVTSIGYSYAGAARFILIKDLDHVKRNQDRQIIRLSALWAVVAVMLVILTRLQLVYRRQSKNLQDEIAQREVVDAYLRESEARFRSLTAMSADFYWESDAEHRLTLRTESHLEVADGAFQQTRPVGKRRWEMPSLAPDDAGWQRHRDLLDAHMPFRDFEISRIRDNDAVHHVAVSGDPIFNAAGEFTGYHGVGADITVRKQAEKLIHELAFYDQLTGLPNRTLLLDRVKQAMTASARNDSYGALLLIDLDNFKTINDTLGHDIGDLLLKEVAQRLTACVRAGDTVARLGGDEFVVMLTSLDTSDRNAAKQTEAVGEKILAALNQTYFLNNSACHSTPSVGVILFTGQQIEIEELLKQADLAMYKSKDAGRNALHFFDPDMEVVVMKRAALEKDLREAIEEGQFLLHYQAQIAGGQPTGAEVLVRWLHPQRGLVSPAEFIPLAEETALILPLGQWVLQTACRQLAQWAARPETENLTVAVNVSARQFRHAGFVDQVLAILKDTGANPRRLKLELTESLLVTDVEDVIETMFALKAKGVGFSLDDFGTGYSSLTYLKRLPLDQLKIDQSFVRDVLTDPNDAAIAKTIVALAQSLGLNVIAEGVETEAQRDFLAEFGCHAYQGYFFSRPLPIDGFENFFAEFSPGPTRG